MTPSLIVVKIYKEGYKPKINLYHKIKEATLDVYNYIKEMNLVYEVLNVMKLNQQEIFNHFDETFEEYMLQICKKMIEKGEIKLNDKIKIVSYVISIDQKID